MTRTDRAALILFCTSLVVSLAGVLYFDHKINDPSEPPQMGSSLAATAEDIGRASRCAREVLAAQQNHGLSVTRHRLVITEWQCSVAAKRITQATS